MRAVTHPGLQDAFARLRSQRGQMTALAVALALLALLPTFTGAGALAVITTDLVFLQLCYAWNLVGGFLGELSLGHMIFWAIGSFGTIFALNAGLPVVPMVMGLAVVAAGIGVAMALSIRLARLEGLLYVAIFTLILGVLGQSIAENWSTLGASTGVVTTRLPGIGPVGQYEMVLVLVLVAVVANVAVAVSRRGPRWRALRDDQRAAAVCGIQATRQRMVAYAGSAALCALGGAFQGYYLGSASGRVSLDVTVLITVSLAVFVGGPGTLLGPLAGWLVIYGLGSVVTSVSTSIHASLYAQVVEFGVALVALRLVVPRLGKRDLLSGVVHLVVRPRSRAAERRPATVVHPVPTTVGAAPARRAEHRARPGVDGPLVVAGIHKSFGGLHVLRGVDFRIEPGEVVALLGANGAGKSTLCNVLSGLLPVDRGAVSVGEVALSGMSPAQRAAFGVGRTFQTPRLFASLTLAENLTVTGDVSQGAAAAALLEARVTTEGSTVSSDAEFFARRLTEVARAVEVGSHVLMLDEPLAGLTEDEHQVVLGMARAAAARGARVLIVEHLVPAVAPVVDRMVVLGDGVVIADGPPSAVLVDQRVVQSYLGQPLVVPA